MISELRQVLPLRLQVSTLFLFLMWMFFQVYQPWQPVDQDLLYGTGEFSNVTDLSGWARERGRVEWSDDTGYVALKPRARLRFNLPANSGDLLLCSGKIKTSDLATGKKSWDAARIMVYFEDDKGQIQWSHPHDVGYLSGDSGWQSFTTMIEVPQFARKGWIELAHYGRSGTASFDDVTVKPAIWKQTYPHWQIFFGMLWASIMMWLLLNTHFWDVAWGKPLLVSGILIIIGVTLPPATMFQVASSGAKLSEKVLHTAEDVLPVTGQEIIAETTQPAKVTEKKPAASMVPKPVGKPVVKTVDKLAGQEAAQEEPQGIVISSTDVQKLGHSLLFACLGYFAFLAFYGKVSTALLTYTLVLFAVSTEILQLVIDGRLFGVIDLGLDLVGIAIGAFTAWLICHVRRRN